MSGSNLLPIKLLDLVLNAIPKIKMSFCEDFGQHQLRFRNYTSGLFPTAACQIETIECWSCQVCSRNWRETYKLHVSGPEERRRVSEFWFDKDDPWVADPWVADSSTLEGKHLRGRAHRSHKSRMLLLISLIDCWQWAPAKRFVLKRYNWTRNHTAEMISTAMHAPAQFWNECKLFFEDWRCLLDLLCGNAAVLVHRRKHWHWHGVLACKRMLYHWHFASPRTKLQNPCHFFY